QLSASLHAAAAAMPRPANVSPPDFPSLAPNFPSFPSRVWPRTTATFTGAGLPYGTGGWVAALAAVAAALPTAAIALRPIAPYRAGVVATAVAAAVIGLLVFGCIVANRLWSPGWSGRFGLAVVALGFAALAVGLLREWAAASTVSSAPAAPPVPPPATTPPAAAGFAPA
ncbi:MAG: hypothetical protein JWO31_364, partial [Phycisphaerales bacterium]|nr:hypothetical protein [Phycisphaerales bacterium]